MEADGSGGADDGDTYDVGRCSDVEAVVSDFDYTSRTEEILGGGTGTSVAPPP